MDYKEWIASLRNSFDNLMQIAVDQLPRLLGFLAFLLIGWILGRILQVWVGRLLGSLDRILGSRSMQAEYERTGIYRSAPQILGKIVFWIVLLFFASAATEILGLPVITNLLGGMANYLPNILAAALIVFAGVLAGNVARRAVTTTAASVGIANEELLGRLTQVVVIVTAVLIGIDQIGIDVHFLTLVIAIALGTTLSGISLAFGLGAKTVVSNMIASHYLSRVYQVGHRIKIGEIEGQILEMTPTSAILQTNEGRIHIPARVFDETPSVLLTEGNL